MNQVLAPKRIIFYGLIVPVIISFLLTSCASVSYQHFYEHSKGLDFQQGTWLVNTIEGDIHGKSRIVLTNLLLQELKELGGDSVYYIEDVHFDYLVPENIQFILANEAAGILHKTTGYDFLVNMKTQKIRDDLLDVIFSPPEVYSKSESEVTLVVYDIHTGQKIYSQRIVASVSLNEDDDDIKFAKSANSLIFKALKKGLKDLSKYSTSK
jgi:hypothetical protein